jgi:F0F1-type ATP synthase alpha subunit
MKQAMLLFLIHSDIIEKIKVEDIKEFKSKYLDLIKTTPLYKEIYKTQNITDDQYEKLKKIASEYIANFIHPGSLRKGGKK